MFIKYLLSQAQPQPPGSFCQADPTAVGPPLPHYPSISWQVLPPRQPPPPNPNQETPDEAPEVLCVQRNASSIWEKTYWRIPDGSWAYLCPGKPGLVNHPNPWRWNKGYLRVHVACWIWVDHAGLRTARFSQTSQQFNTLTSLLLVSSTQLWLLSWVCPIS